MSKARNNMCIDSDDEPLSSMVPNKKRQRVKEEDEDFEEPAKKVKKSKKVKKEKKSKKKASSSRSRSVTPSKSRKPAAKKAVARKIPKIKELHPLKQLELAMKSHLWWEDEKLDEGERWRTLEHNGIMFPPAYKPHGINLLYDGKQIEMTPEQEEVATFYAAMPLDGPQLGNEKTAKTFNKNFFKDFKQLLGSKSEVKSFDKIDWTNLRAHVQKERELKKAMTKEQKEEKKRKDDEVRMKYAFALVDGHLQKVGNIMVEPPGLFRGRGDHPKTGTLKRRVMPEQITLNLGESAAVPPCPLPGHSWGKIVHKHDVTWLAYWKENVMDAHKYVWLAASSGFKGQSDLEKYEKARKLKKMIQKIRSDYERKLKGKDAREKQLGTAMWVIDRLALRVGNEKDDSAADTVGCCSLRVEHIELEKEGHRLTLDFLGKDSMRHLATYDLEEQYGATGIAVYKNFESFVKKKKGGEDVFEQLTPAVLNDHLKTLMPGLSAKVFRTFNASSTLEDTLPHEMDEGLTVQEKVVAYNAANRKVAILCNHQKTVTKAAKATLEKFKAQTDRTKEELEQLIKMKKSVVKGKSIKTKSNTDDKEKKALERHLFAKQPTEAQITKRIATWKDRIKKQELNLKNRDDNKDVALGTSKINYMDPRITVAWTKRNEVPIEKVFATALRDKFPWAMSTKMDFKW